MASYDELCADATSAAEMRLLDHFKQFGGEVWEIGSGCQHCRTKSEDTSSLKKCSNCCAALFCNRDCQKQGWRKHKKECTVISTFQKSQATESDVMSAARLEELLSSLSWSSDAPKEALNPKVSGVAKSLAFDGSMVPGWFFTEDFDQLPKERQQQLYAAVLELYSLLRDEDSWTRDKESFPRSSYTYVDSLAHSLRHSEAARSAFVALNGHLLLFSAWLQNPEPPANQSLPFEAREFFGVVDSLLQITKLRDGVDAFMALRSSSS